MIHSDDVHLSGAEPASSLVATPLGKRGKHKIFIGMAPGVGKTYRMLEEGHRLRAEGIDVVIGLLETHGREETAERADGLEIVPRQTLTYRGVALTEMDTDAVIARSPKLALIDELAHTNVPGSVREKRYQDVELILNAGIDVYSTVNIQHVESLNDLVARITEVIVRERIPDRVLEEADEVVVVDVTPETLEERLKDGKIYAPTKIDQALQHFFQRRNLIALRELALREVADNVEDDRIDEANAGSCNILERLLICVSTHPNSVQLIRRGARAASYMNARFYVLFVVNPDRFLTKAESLHVETCEKLCREFGGEFLRVESNQVLKTIVDVAKTQRITQIILGASRQPWWHTLLKGSLSEHLIRQLKGVDLHIMATDSAQSRP